MNQSKLQQILDDILRQQQEQKPVGLMGVLSDKTFYQQTGPDNSTALGNGIDLNMLFAQSVEGRQKKQKSYLEMPRYTRKNNQIYDAGSKISDEYAIRLIEKNIAAMKANEQSWKTAPNEIQPLIKRAADSARQVLEKDNFELQEALKK